MYQRAFRQWLGTPPLKDRESPIRVRLCLLGRPRLERSACPHPAWLGDLVVGLLASGCSEKLTPEQQVIVNLSGRGDKDILTVAKIDGIEL